MHWLNWPSHLYNWTVELDLALRLRQAENALSEREKSHKKMQQRLQETNKALNYQVIELQARLKESEKRNQELDTFAHTVSHDLKNPVGSVLNFTEILLENASLNQPLNEKSVEILKYTQKATEKMVDIIDALQLLAGVSRKEKVLISPINMCEIIDEVLEQRLVHKINESQARIEFPQFCPCPKFCSKVQGYKPWIEEIWMNYISNALKYGGQPPHLQFGAKVENRGMVRFWVRDNGIGLTKEEQTRLFMPFTRLGKVQVEGHGLGLSIVRQIVNKLGGQAGVESVVGQGSLFYFTLPIE